MLLSQAGDYNTGTKQGTAQGPKQVTEQGEERGKEYTALPRRREGQGDEMGLSPTRRLLFTVYWAKLALPRVALTDC